MQLQQWPQPTLKESWKWHCTSEMFHIETRGLGLCNPVSTRHWMQIFLEDGHNLAEATSSSEERSLRGLY